MAALNLGPYNTLTLAASTPTQIISPGGGHCYFNLLNLGTGNLFISNLSNVGNNPTSFKLPTGLVLLPIAVYGPTGIWVAVDTAGSISVAVVPRT